MVSEGGKSKKQKLDECFIDRLPDDLLEKIFLSLPAENLFSCIDVSEYWKSFIMNPQFIASHLQRASRQALMFFPREMVGGKRYPSDAVIVDDSWSQSTHAVSVIGPDDLVFGSCNGLLGLYTKSTTIKIANFVTGECLHLEKPRKNLRGDHFSLYNLGLHPVKKEYTVTHFIGDYSETRSPYNKDQCNTIQVYKLGDEKWRDIQTPEALSLSSVRNNGVVTLDGTMYWLTKPTVPSQKHVIMSFDLGEETFAQMQLPAGVDDGDAEYSGGGHRQYWIREIEGKLCVATARTTVYQTKMPIDKVQIWTLEETMEQRWSLKYDICCSYHYIVGPSFVHGGKFMTQYIDYKLYSHEFLAQSFELGWSNMARLLDFSPRRPDNMQCYTCVKSLVRLDSYKNSAVVCRTKQKDGWKLKKWQAWENEVSSIENLRTNVFILERRLAATLDNIDAMCKSFEHGSDGVAERVRMEFNSMVKDRVQDLPTELKPFQRLNCVEQKKEHERLKDRFTEVNQTLEVMKWSYDNICKAKKVHMMEQGLISKDSTSFLKL